MIVTPCPLCQANVEIYQSEINKKQGTKFNMPVLYYSQLMTVAYGGSAQGSGPRWQHHPAKLQIAVKIVPTKRARRPQRCLLRSSDLRAAQALFAATAIERKNQIAAEGSRAPKRT